MKKIVSIRCRPLQIFVLAFIFTFVITSLAYSSESKQAKKILIIYSDVSEMAYVKLINKGIFDFFASAKGADVEYFIEYMERGRYKTHEYESKLREMYSLKYSTNRPDLIIAASYQALKFINAYGRELFAGVPVVFTAMGKHELDDIAIDNDLITGIYTEIDFGKQFETIQRLQPDLERIVVLTGSSSYDILWRNKIAEIFSAYKGDVEVEYLHDLSMDEIKERISLYQDRTAIYYFMIYEDGAGNSYEPWKALSLFAPESGVPVFSSFDTFMGYGTVGGYQISFELFGKLTAEIAHRILEGEAPSNIPINKHTDWQYIFDWRELKRWNIDESDLPEGSIVRYRELSTWDLYCWHIIVSVFFIVSQAILITFLLLSIAKRKKAEESIARQVKLLDLIFKNSLDSIVLLDKDYNFIWVSETYAKSCQRDSSEFAGHNHFEFYPSNLKEEFDAAKKGKSIYRKYARPFIFPDHPEWGETYWDLGLVPIFDDDGEIEMFLFTLKDITERKKSQEKLIQAEQRYRTVADFTYDWEWWRSPEGKYIYMSPSCERITGYKWDEFINNPHLVDEVILPEDQEEWRKHNIEVQTAHKPVEVQFRIKRKDGCVRWIEHICQMVKDTDGEFMGFRASNRDITGRRQVEEEANRLRSEYLHIARVSAMGELTASLAHELKQPLAAIRSNAQAGQRFLAKEKPDLDELSEILVDIIKDNRRADEVIGRLRTLMRKSELQIAELNINNVIQEIFPLIRSYEIMRNISLEFELDDKIPSVAGDRVQLQQVILNLIMNSSEALENIDGDIRRIVIRTSQKNHNNVTVAIRDNGTGIDEQSPDSLFEPFYTTKQEGMGMGLPISRSIIEAHGGNLWAENNPDRGATFYFTIPVFKSSLA